MDSKQKAKELVEMYYNLMFVQANYDEFDKALWDMSKRQALIAVDEIIEAHKITVRFKSMYEADFLDYWQEVKEEINKL